VSAIGDAYSSGAAAWADGPTRVYGRLADLLVAFSPEPVAGRQVLDLGSGTGAGSRAARAAGASRLIAADLALGMLLTGRDERPPAAVGDALALPFRAGAFDVVLAPFSLNHLADPAAGVREAARVGRSLVASTYAADDDHPVKAAVETALREVGWQRPAWYADIKAAMASWDSIEGAANAIQRGGMHLVRVTHETVAFPELAPDEMAAWRLGMAQSAGFVAALDSRTQAELLARSVELLGPHPEPVVRRVIFLAATRGYRPSAENVEST
jgi:SAM-dependent methyltransferase